MDYYTQPVLASSVDVTATTERKELGSFAVSLGDIDVTWRTTAYKKIKFFTMEMIGQGELELPSQTLATRSSMDYAARVGARQHQSTWVTGPRRASSARRTSS